MKHLIVGTATRLVLSTFLPRFNIADLGCSLGPNILTLIEEIVNAIDDKVHRKLVDRSPDHGFLNDLPSNKFSFQELTGF